MIAIIAENRKTASLIAATAGAIQKHNEYFENDDYTITWISECPITLTIVTDDRRTVSTTDGCIPVKHKFRRIIRQKKTSNGLTTDQSAVRRLKVIDEILERCSSIIVATAPDGEGERAFRYVYEYLGYTKPFRRMRLSELTEEAIRIGLYNPQNGNDFDTMYAAAECRAKADITVSFNASRAFALATGIQDEYLGRLHIPVLAMICSRYKACRRFVSTSYWQLHATLEHNGALGKFRYFKNIPTMREAEDMFKRIASHPQATITKVTRKRTLRRQPLPYNLSELTKECCAIAGLSSKRVLNAAVSLYEKQLISDPRTDCRYISDDIMKRMPSILQRLLIAEEYSAYYGAIHPKRLPHQCVNNEKAKIKHAIIATGIRPKGLDNDERTVYDMIARRILEAFASGCKTEQVTVDAVIAGLPFRLQERQTAAAECGTIYGLSGNRYTEPVSKRHDIPEFERGDTPDIAGHGIGKCHTIPEPLYTEATLLKAMECAGNETECVSKYKRQCSSGIGTAEIRTRIIADLLEKGYIEYSGETIIPTAKGLSLYGKVKGMVIADMNIAAEHEKLLEKMQRGETAAEDFMRIIEAHTAKAVKEIMSIGQPRNTIKDE